MTASHTILVAIFSRFAAWNIPPEYVAALAREFPQHTFQHVHSTEEALESVANADVLFTAYQRDHVLEAGRNLKWIHSPAAGLEGLLSPAIINSPVIVTNSRGISADTIAEHVLAVVLALFRQLPRAFDAQRARKWVQSAVIAEAPIRTLAGSRVLIVGLGAIGLACAQRFASLSAHVDGVRRRPELPRASAVDRVVSSEHLIDLLPSADVVVLAAPETRATRHLIGARQMRAMRPGSILVNVSRGSLVDETALAGALTLPHSEKTIAAAALDVFEREPLPPESPLWNLPNVLITPHIAGLRPDHWEAVCTLFSQNLRRFDAGQPLLNVVDKTEGY